MITEYFWPQLDDMDLEDMWFQQDGATSHKANVTINLLETKFGERVISWNGAENFIDIQTRFGFISTFVALLLKTPL